ncbi:hypothetical protein LLEC1_00829 [Akanthomyces lecanii]|uniref:2EXR domain-containing protein n=1 Tax=Cordyceps confragosa TaxID=2714763 RepID=A0A179I482_CORDF|nr:hypothetical protein LLEC1_00829 [Akanthomyces lecanii]
MAESVPNVGASFPFDRLLPEIQLLVLEAALPQQRVFHVSDATKNGFSFYIRHPPPALLSACHGTRAAILRSGVFLDGGQGAFFLPAVDLLYFDRSHQRHVRAADGEAPGRADLGPGAVRSAAVRAGAGDAAGGDQGAVGRCVGHERGAAGEGPRTETESGQGRAGGAASGWAEELSSAVGGDEKEEEERERWEQREQETDWRAYTPGQDAADWRS